MNIKRNAGILEKYTMYPLTLGYALITGFLRYKLLPVICLAGYRHSILFLTKLVTLWARYAHVKSFLRFYRRMVQTTATDGGSVDFA